MEKRHFASTTCEELWYSENIWNEEKEDGGLPDKLKMDADAFEQEQFYAHSLTWFFIMP